MALDNDNPKTSKETDEETNDQKIKVLKNKDMEDNPLFENQQEEDVSFRDYIEAFSFNDKLEKEEITKLEQDFIDSDLEKET
jgi:hypothetical protein